MILIGVQARMGATRLPGKPLLKVLGKPLLSYLLERLLQVHSANCIALLTTSSPSNRCLVDLAKERGVANFCGSEEDVLERFALAARHFSATTVVRITADCPLLDPILIEQFLNVFYQVPGQYDYLSNTLDRSYPRGMDIEVFSAISLWEAHRKAKEPHEREHVTPYLYHHPEYFTLGQITYPVDLSSWRWTVDTPEDFAVVARLLAAVYPAHPSFTLEDLIQVAKAHPEWMKFNAHVLQKPLVL